MVDQMAALEGIDAWRRSFGSLDRGSSSDTCTRSQSDRHDGELFLLIGQFFQKCCACTTEVRSVRGP